MKTTINVKSCEKCIVAHGPALYRSKNAAEMCIECQSNQYKHFKPESQFKEQYFIEQKTAELLQNELNHAHKKHGEFDIKLAFAILVEEVGEVAKELQEYSEIVTEIRMSNMSEISQKKLMTKKDQIIENLKSELMQVATVCLRWVDNLEKEKK